MLKSWTKIFLSLKLEVASMSSKHALRGLHMKGSQLGFLDSRLRLHLLSSFLVILFFFSLAAFAQSGPAGQHSEGIKSNASGPPPTGCTVEPIYVPGKCEGGLCLVNQYNCCGNGRLEYPGGAFTIKPESCEPALDANCRADCTKCADGLLQTNQGEACDPGSGTRPAVFTLDQSSHSIKSCDSDCAFHYCGDGTPDFPSEECDEGTQNGQENSGCSNDCKKTAKCGNDVIELGEKCENNGIFIPDVPAPRSCDALCQSHWCGDGVKDLVHSEECDAGSLNGEQDSGCTIDCKTVPICNNGTLEAGEACDGQFFATDHPSPRSCDGICNPHWCGDGTKDLDNGEECDAGSSNGDPTSFCSIDCKSTSICFNGTLESAETCEYDNELSDYIYANSYPDPKGCNSSCQAIYCGDGVNNFSGEECDLGAQNGQLTSTCSFDCKFKTACGDNKIEGNETCEVDGTYSSNFPTPRSCVNCFAHWCGDGGINQPSEQCDRQALNGQPNSGCSIDCKIVPSCGDGKVEGAETCENSTQLYVPNVPSPRSCVACQALYCGDGTKNQTVEECDEGIKNGTAQSNCLSNCKIKPLCPNGQIDNSETCEINLSTGNHFYVNTLPDPKSCLNCQAVFCGDGTKNQSAEECDLGASNGAPGQLCSSDCKTILACGNKVIDPGEDCDLPQKGVDGNKYLFSCDANCQSHYCGDSIVDSAEDCDGLSFSSAFSSFNRKFCDATCKAHYCGDGEIELTEDCDDGNNINNDACPNNCELPICGDSIVQTELGETCDDGNKVDGDGCSNQCQGDCNLYSVNFWMEIDECAWATGSAPDSSRSVLETDLSCMHALVPNGGMNWQYYTFDDDNAVYAAGRNLGLGNAVQQRAYEVYYNSGKLFYGVFMTGPYLDRNCQPVSARNLSTSSVCGSVDIGYRVSPISLDFGPESAWTSVKFDLTAEQKNDWVVWKASSTRPLLVLDPEQNGEIKDGRQLFGNWTFGGPDSGITKSSQALNSAAANTQWKNGYEALAQLDRNKNGTVEGLELKGLALWFDHNKNAISEPGEVKPITEVGITSLRTSYDQTDEGSGTLISKAGYTLQRDNQTITGDSLDWYSNEYNSQLAATNELNLTNDSKEQEPNLVNPKNRKQKIEQSRFNGLWYWESTKDRRTHGLLQLSKTDGILTGQSVVETPLMPNQRQIRSLLTRTALEGEIESEDLNSAALKFRIEKDGIVTESVAKLNPITEELEGESLARGADGKELSYQWKARKIAN